MEPADIINIVLQSIIAIFLIWYAIETYRLRKQTAYQCKISIQPIIDFIHDPKSPPLVFTLENVGLGAALNLHLYLWMSKESQLYGLPELLRPSIIKPNQKIQTKPLQLIDSSRIKKDHPRLAKVISNMPSVKGPGTSIAIYEDAAGNLYYSQQYSDPSAGSPFSFGPL